MTKTAADRLERVLLAEGNPGLLADWLDDQGEHDRARYVRHLWGVSCTCRRLGHLTHYGCQNRGGFHEPVGVPQDVWDALEGYLDEYVQRGFAGRYWSTEEECQRAVGRALGKCGYE
jgi:hypothetical protein